MRSTEYLYRPQHKNRKELINDFVIRNDIYQRMLDSITSETVIDPSQHILVEGKRGMGKTTLMLRLTYELQKTDKLKKRFVPCKFNEEEYGIGSLAILWERIAEHLEEDERFEGILDIFDDIENSNGEEQFIKEVLKWLEAKKVIAVVFIDNFFQIIEKFTKQDQQRFREVLIKTPYLKIVAGSARFMEKHAGNYAAPFFEFFKREKLDKLNASETKELLVHLAKKHKAQNVIDTMKNEPHRIDNIRILCGGVPRTLVTFFEVLMDDVDGDSIDDLKLVMDRVNELYLQRMNSLSKKEQPIINAMALHWEAIGTGILAEKLGETSKSISSVLNKLEKQQIIEKVKTNTKNHLWRIEERFFNIWYLLTQAPRRYQKKVKWLTAFIEALYSEDDFLRRLKSHLTYLSKDYANPEHAVILSNAFLGTKYIKMEDRDEVVIGLRSLLDKKAYDLSEIPKTNSELYGQYFEMIKGSKFNQACSIVEDNGGVFSPTYSLLVDNFKKSGIKAVWDVEALRNEWNLRIDFAYLLAKALDGFTKTREFSDEMKAAFIEADPEDSDAALYGSLLFLSLIEHVSDAYLEVAVVFVKILESVDQLLTLFNFTSEILYSRLLYLEFLMVNSKEPSEIKKELVTNSYDHFDLKKYGWTGLSSIILGLILNDKTQNALNLLDHAFDDNPVYLDEYFIGISTMLLAAGQIEYLKSRTEISDIFEKHPEVSYLIKQIGKDPSSSLIIPPELDEPLRKMAQEVENWKRVFAEHST